VPRKKKTTGESTSKAQAIRDTAKALPKPLRPRDVVSALAEKGITVSSAQVSTTLRAAGMKRRRRRKAKGVAETAATKPNGALTAKDLFAVKEFAKQFGGVKRASEALDLLRQLR
jgi:hypothetical protein